MPLALILAVCGVGYATADLLSDRGRQRVVEATIHPLGRGAMALCYAGTRYNCVVDGDTVWVNGIKIRIEDIDTPEVSEPRCTAEGELGAKATSRLIELLNRAPFLVVNNGGRDQDMYGRKLRIIESEGKSVGAVLVEEGLARWYGSGRRGWC
jgi:endonuclease YncB( thermonuclease family)